MFLKTISAIALAAFANSNAGSKLYMCATAQQVDLDRTAFEALTWVEIKGVGSHGEGGSSTNILTYDTWGDAVIQKAKGLTDAGSPEIELARIPTDSGQKLLRTAAATNFNYAFKMVRNDPAYVGGVPTIIYNRGLVTGPKRPFGRNEDFDLETFTLALNQREVIVDPTLSGIAPSVSVIPAITGTAKVATALTLSNGTWAGDAVITYSYAWFVGGVQVPGATASTYTPVTDDIGKIVQGRVVATNASGYGVASSSATAAVVA